MVSHFKCLIYLISSVLHHASVHSEIQFFVWDCTFSFSQFIFSQSSFSQHISLCVFFSAELVWPAISVSSTHGSNRTPPSWRPRSFLKRGWRSIFWEESGRWGSRKIIMWHKMLVFSLFLVLLKVWLQWAQDLLAVCLLSYSSVTDVLVNKVITDSLHSLLQKTGHAVRAIGRLSNMALMAGVHAKKGSPTEGTTLPYDQPLNKRLAVTQLVNCFKEDILCFFTSYIL